MGIALSSCENIFAPKIDTTSTTNIITDQKTIEGLYQNFRYAYTFKDTTVYSGLLTDDFVFTYRDYNLGYDVSWDKYTEMRTTSGLFQNTQKLEIIWNNIVYQDGDSLNTNVRRSLNLTITFNPNNVERLNGFADMNLVRETSDSKWKIKKWRDESF
ncbi:MAG: hypothetical protein JST55_05455 [Bacteroidetes bacterium]|nr:hypothetical protein [Bacteroidota bacterium]